MALFTGISDDNRVVEQGNTYVYDIEPAVTVSTIAVEQGSGTSGQGSGGTNVYEKETVTQWHGVLHFSKRYKYVGLTKSAAQTAAAAIRSAYTIDADKWAVGISVETNNGVSTALYKWLNVGDQPMTCAAVTPVKSDGPMWEVEVDVDATFEVYKDDDNAPTDAQMVALASDIVNFPED